MDTNSGKLTQVKPLDYEQVKNKGIWISQRKHFDTPFKIPS